jgi:hypothetical protein
MVARADSVGIPPGGAECCETRKGNEFRLGEYHSFISGSSFSTRNNSTKQLTWINFHPFLTDS